MFVIVEQDEILIRAGDMFEEIIDGVQMIDLKVTGLLPIAPQVLYLESSVLDS